MAEDEWIGSITDSMNENLSKLWEIMKHREALACCSPWGHKELDMPAQRLKRLPAMWETWVQSLGWEDPLEKEMATHSSILAWRIPWMEELGGL